MQERVINLEAKLAKITEQWSPKIIAQMNNYHFKLVKLKGDFIWHSHSNTDEVFLVLSGELHIDFRSSSARLGRGDMMVIPQGIEHKPYAQEECHVLLVEPIGTLNTGDAGGERTVFEVEWI